MAEKLKGFSFGGGTFSRTSPEKLTGETKIVNVVLPFGEALKLSVAMQACIMWLNEKNRATKEGKEAALNLAVNFARRRVVVTRGMKVTKAVKIAMTAVSLMAAALVGGCGGGESVAEPDEVVVDEQESIEAGQVVSWKLDPGTYKVELTASGDGVILKWVGSSCPGSDETKNCTITCEMTQAGELILENPAALRRGATTTVTVKVTRLAG